MEEWRPAMSNEVRFKRYPGMRAPIETEAQADDRREDFIRADGGCLCSHCGHEYRQHPLDAGKFWFLHVLCNGRRVKL